MELRITSSAKLNVTIIINMLLCLPETGRINSIIDSNDNKAFACKSADLYKNQTNVLIGRVDKNITSHAANRPNRLHTVLD